MRRDHERVECALALGCRLRANGERSATRVEHRHGKLQAEKQPLTAFPYPGRRGKLLRSFE